MPELLANSWSIIFGAAYVCFLVAVAAYDARHRRIPNAIVYPGIAGAALFAFFRPGTTAALLLSGLFAAGLLVVLDIVSRGGMGMGDVKLAAFIGLVSGWPTILVALLVAFAAGAVGGIALIAAGRISRRDPVPFAPALAVGGLVALVAGPQIVAMFWPIAA